MNVFIDFGEESTQSQSPSDIDIENRPDVSDVDAAAPMISNSGLSDCSPIIGTSITGSNITKH